MNWTGGSLGRSRNASTSVTAIQKRHFAKVRARLHTQHLLESESPGSKSARQKQTSLDQYETTQPLARKLARLRPHASQAGGGSPVAYGATSDQSRLNDRRGHPSAPVTISSPSSSTSSCSPSQARQPIRPEPQNLEPNAHAFNAQRLWLLNRADWVGLSRPHPARELVSARKHSPRTARFRRLNDDRSQSATRYRPTKIRRTGYFDRPVLNPGASVNSVLQEDISVKIGSAVDRSQKYATESSKQTIQLSNGSDEMLLDNDYMSNGHSSQSNPFNGPPRPRHIDVESLVSSWSSQSRIQRPKPGDNSFMPHNTSSDPLFMEGMRLQRDLERFATSEMRQTERQVPSDDFDPQPASPEEHEAVASVASSPAPKDGSEPSSDDAEISDSNLQSGQEPDKQAPQGRKGSPNTGEGQSLHTATNSTATNSSPQLEEDSANDETEYESTVQEVDSTLPEERRLTDRYLDLNADHHPQSNSAQTVISSTNENAEAKIKVQIQSQTPGGLTSSYMGKEQVPDEEAIWRFFIFGSQDMTNEWDIEEEEEEIEKGKEEKEEKELPSSPLEDRQSASSSSNPPPTDDHSITAQVDTSPIKQNPRLHSDATSTENSIPNANSAAIAAMSTQAEVGDDENDESGIDDASDPEVGRILAEISSSSSVTYLAPNSNAPTQCEPSSSSPSSLPLPQTRQGTVSASLHAHASTSTSSSPIGAQNEPPLHSISYTRDHDRTRMAQRSDGQLGRVTPGAAVSARRKSIIRFKKPLPYVGMVDNGGSSSSSSDAYGGPKPVMLLGRGVDKEARERRDRRALLRSSEFGGTEDEIEDD